MKSIILFVLCLVLSIGFVGTVFKAVLMDEQAACTYYNSPQKPMWCRDVPSLPTNK